MGFKDTAKEWFKIDLIPTEAQFFSVFNWIRWKDEKIPITDIFNIEDILNAKAEEAVLTDHLTDANAHAAEFNAKEDKDKKGAADGYVPLNEFVKIASTYLNIVDDLVTGGATELLSAEQGKVLKTQIDAINTLLASDNVNLDNVQELVDAIETLQTSLSTILVNDLTTGGVTKALTAEMGKSLKALIDALDSNKVDKVAGERLINAAEITKLGNQSGTNTGDQDLTPYQLIDNQIFVSASGTIQDSWHGKIVTFTATSTQTVPASGLRDGFKFDGIVDPTVTLNTAMTAPKAWYGGYTGAAIPENSIFTFIQRKGDTNKVSIYGL